MTRQSRLEFLLASPWKASRRRLNHKEKKLVSHNCTPIKIGGKKKKLISRQLLKSEARERLELVREMTHAVSCLCELSVPTHSHTDKHTGLFAHTHAYLHRLLHVHS